MKQHILPLLFLGAALSCAAPQPEPITASDAWFGALSQHCGNAYAGKLTYEPEGDDMLTGTETLIVHFRECSDSLIKAPFHIELEDAQDWNRSRTWIFTKHADNLELRHDHRNPDGTDDEVTMYGGFSRDEGTAIRHEFKSEPRSLESGVFRGWRIEVVPGVRYTYGTIQDTTWTWRIDFDLSTPIEAPPAPWGF